MGTNYTIEGNKILAFNYKNIYCVVIDSTTSISKINFQIENNEFVIKDYTGIANNEKGIYLNLNHNIPFELNIIGNYFHDSGIAICLQWA